MTLKEFCKLIGYYEVPVCIEFADPNDEDPDEILIVAETQPPLQGEHNTIYEEDFPHSEFAPYANVEVNFVDICNDYIHIRLDSKKARVIHLQLTGEFRLDDAEVETFYTGGGIWLTGAEIGNKRYVMLEDECLDYYSREGEDDENEPECGFLCQHYLYCKNRDEFTPEEEMLYIKMLADYERVAQ